MINNKIIIKGIISLAVLMLINRSIYAQQPEHAPDSVPANRLGSEQIVPGIFFNLDKNVSTASISTVFGDELYKTPVANLTNTLYGLMPGLNVMQGTGEPGYDAAWLTLRGVGSYNYDSYTIFVDGFQTNTSYFQYLTPAEIESISIFKDAVALAPFGMKGANGVIWVITKRGNIGKPKTQIQLRTGIQNPIKITKPLQAYDYAGLYNEAISNDNGRIWTPRYTQTQLNAYKDGTGVNTDWYDYVLKSNTPFSSADITFDGGGSVARYFVMLGYVGSNGIYDVSNDDTHSNARLQQYNIRSNFDFTLFKIFDGKIDLGGRIEDRKYPGYNGGNLWNNLERYPNNIYPVINENGKWTGTSTYPDNPLASIRDRGYYSTRDRTLQANFSLKERLDFITEGLYLSQSVSFNDWTRGSYDVTRNYARYIGDVQQTPDQDSNYSIWDDWGTNQWNWQQFQVTAGYERIFGIHKVAAAFNYLQYSYNVDANQNGAAWTNMKYGFQNLGGRIHYSYNNKYIAEFAFAYSGSDNYKKGNRFGFYPAISGAWILSNEDFLLNNKSIELLKLRLSAGKSGYDTFDEGRYLYEQYYQWKGNYATGNSSPTWHGGLAPAYIANEDIFAEQSMKYNLGADIQFKHLSVIFDAFMDKRSGIISQDYSIPAVLGVSTPPYRNLGKVTTSGFELTASYRNKIGDLSYNVGGIATYIKDKINYMAELTPPSPLAASTGKAIGTPIGYDAIGFYDITDFAADGNLNNLPVPTFGQVQPGDIKYRDVNEDGWIDERDMLAIGTSDYPDFSYAFYVEAEIKGFDFRMLFQGVSGREVNILSAARNKVIAFENNGNAYAIAQNRWAYYPNQDIDTRNTASYPRLSTLGNNNNYQNSNLWIKNGNFLRLRNIEIGYSLPKRLLSQIRLSKARVFVSAINLFTISSLLSDYELDPETLSGYPGIKSFNIGISVGF
jgi:TonB-linked SusC/RagA family outer membrane protein